MHDLMVPTLIGLVAVAGILGPLLSLKRLDDRLRRAGLQPVGQLTDAAVTLEVTRILGALGYAVRRPVRAEELPFDLIANDALGLRHGVLTRHWREAIGTETVRGALWNGAQMGRAAPMLISVEGFSRQARAVGMTGGAILWNLGELALAVGPLRPEPVLPGSTDWGAHTAPASAVAGGRPVLRLVGGRRTRRQ